MVPVRQEQKTDVSEYTLVVTRPSCRCSCDHAEAARGFRVTCVVLLNGGGVVRASGGVAMQLREAAAAVASGSAPSTCK